MLNINSKIKLVGFNDDQNDLVIHILAYFVPFTSQLYFIL